jgi:hypothetical protein
MPYTRNDHSRATFCDVHLLIAIWQNRIAWPPTQLATPRKSLSPHSVKASYGRIARPGHQHNWPRHEAAVATQCEDTIYWKTALVWPRWPRVFPVMQWWVYGDRISPYTLSFNRMSKASLLFLTRGVYHNLTRVGKIYFFCCYFLNLLQIFLPLLF